MQARVVSIKLSSGLLSGVMTLKSRRSASCFVAAAILSLAGCAFVEPFEPPEVVAGSPTTVTLRAGSLVDAQDAARRYCANYGRRAVEQVRGRVRTRAITFYVYDCVEPVAGQ